MGVDMYDYKLIHRTTEKKLFPPGRLLESEFEHYEYVNEIYQSIGPADFQWHIEYNEEGRDGRHTVATRVDDVIYSNKRITIRKSQRCPSNLGQEYPFEVYSGEVLVTPKIGSDFYHVGNLIQSVDERLPPNTYLDMVSVPERLSAQEAEGVLKDYVRP